MTRTKWLISTKWSVLHRVARRKIHQQQAMIINTRPPFLPSFVISFLLDLLYFNVYIGIFKGKSPFFETQIISILEIGSSLPHTGDNKHRTQDTGQDSTGQDSCQLAGQTFWQTFGRPLPDLWQDL